jgi:hypothetical protein
MIEESETMEQDKDVSKTERKDQKQKKEIVISIIAILILVVAVVGVSYAVWSQSFAGTKTNSVTTGYISFTYTEGSTNVINLTNALPTDDTTGKAMSGTTSEFDFTVSATFAGVSSINYEVYATPITTTLSGDYVKVYLTNGSDVAMTGYTGTVPVYSGLTASSVTGSKKLYSGTLTTSGSSQAFKLRVWVASTYNMPESSATFSFKVNVAATA